MSFRIAVVASVSIMSGCTDSAQSSGIRAAVEVVIADDALRASASIYDGSAPYVISPSEHLTVGVHDQTIDLTYGENNTIYFGRPYFGTGALAQPVAGDEPVTLTLERAEDSRSFAGTAPAELVLEAPATVATGADLVITWSPSSSDPMRWYAGSDQGTIDDGAGTMTFPYDVITTWGTPGSTVELELQRLRVTGGVTVRRIATAEIMVTQ